MEPVSRGPPQLLWKEDFAKRELDESSWSYHTGNGSAMGIPGWGNEELQEYATENVHVSNGVLCLTATKEGPSFRSAKICTKGKRDFYPDGCSPNGIRIEARIKLPKGGQGIWPAFWLLPSEGPRNTSGTGVYGYWPMSGEIDVMEAINDMGITHCALHFGGPGDGHRHVTSQSNAQGGNRLDAGWHTYAVDWTQHAMTFRVDGKVVMHTTCSCRKGHKGGWHTANHTGASCCTKCSPFDRPFHIVLNLAVGGKWPGNPNCFTEFPQCMYVGEVSVWRP